MCSRFKDIEGVHITTMVVVVVALVALILTIYLGQQYFLKETKYFLDAGCDYTYVAGKAEKVWTNCSKPVIKE